MRAWVPLFLLAAACGDDRDGNRAPIVGELSLSTLEDVPVTQTIDAFDNDLGDVLVARVVTQPAHGTVTFAELSLTYSPAPDYHGNDRFTFVVGDGVDETPVDVRVSVGTINDPPIGGPDSLATNEDIPRTVPVVVLLGNDTDADGDPITLTAVGNAVNGTVNLNTSTGNVTFVPGPNFKGGGSFRYEITDGELTSSVLVDVVVGGVNDAPVANDDSGFTTAENTPLTIQGTALLANDTDVDTQTLTIQSVANGTNGTVVLNGGDPIFTPTTGFSGTATFTYLAFDGIATDSATVTITVTNTNDNPVAQDDSATTDEDTAVTIAVLSNDTDLDGPSALSVQSVGSAVGGTPVVNGDNTITFTPTANFAGPTASFTYVVTDGSATDTAIVTITINPINDPVTAVDDTGFTTDEKTPITLTTLTDNDTDVDIATQSQTLSITAVSNAVNGSVALVAGQPVFTPTTNSASNQTGSFEYTVSDGSGSTDVGLVSITITPVNDAPTAVDDSGSTNEDTAVTFSNLTANDTDPENQTLTIQSVSNASNGTVVLNGDGTVTFTPTANFPGPTASFDYTISDGAGGTDTATVTIAVTAQNDAVTAVDDSGFTTDEKTPITLTTLTANDTDVDIATQGQTLTITTVTNAVNGTVALNGGQPIFTPTTNSASDQTGTFEYTVSDGAGSTDVGLVTITITPVNDPPVAVNDSLQQIDVATDFSHSGLLLNDSDGGDGAALTITAVSDPLNGTVVLNASTITFTPTAPGPASFTYTISDGGAVTSTATVNIDVSDCGDGAVDGQENCDDGNNDPDDGCSPTCNVETGFTCDAAEPSVCTTICGDGLVKGAEECDDGPGDTDDADGCTTQCKVGVVCDANTFSAILTPTIDTVVDPATGHCFGRIVNVPPLDHTAAEAACVTAGGHLAVITTVGEQDAVSSMVPTDAWLGGTEDGNPTDDIFAWVTGEAFTFDAWATNQPDPGVTGCMQMLVTGEWSERPCTDPLLEMVCEVAPRCGDGVTHAVKGEECDDGNLTNGDGCSAACTIEVELAEFTFTGALGSEVTLAADFGNGIAVPVISRGAGLSATSGADTFSAASWTTAAILDATDFFSFTITPLPGATVTLSKIVLDERRSGTGIRQWVVRSSLDGFVTDLASFTVPDDTNTRTGQTIVLPATFANHTSPVEFRIFGFEAEAAGGTWRVDNVVVFGSSSAP